MENERLATALETATMQISRDDPDPLMRAIMITPPFAKTAYQALFRGLAYFLRFKTEEAKNSSVKKFGAYVSALGHFVFGAYISVIDNDGEESVVLDYTFDENDFKDMIESNSAISIDEVVNYHQYVNSACKSVGGEDTDVKSFYLMPETVHAVCVTAAQVLRHYIEALLDDKSSDAVVEYSGLFTATGYIGADGNKHISFEKDELLKQLIKNDDANAVPITDEAAK